MLGKSSEGADAGEGLRSRMDRVVFRDAYGRVRQCSVEDWESFVRTCERNGMTRMAVELCRVGSREEAMRFVNLAKESNDGEI
jgi:hypothetical protein